MEITTFEEAINVLKEKFNISVYENRKYTLTELPTDADTEPTVIDSFDTDEEIINYVNELIKVEEKSKD
jgi:hypothetical protein